jgi:putative ABC transport system ATP-binding protein
MSTEVATEEKKAPSRETAETIIRLKSITKSYERGGETLKILDQLALEVPQGAFEALMGPSGSGKSTLLNLIAGLDRPTSGSINVAGKQLESLSEAELARWRANTIGFVFQSYNLMPVLTAVENVELPLLVARVKAKEARRRAHAALELVGVGARADHLPEELSGGQRQRVTIARALVNEPAIVWADEPTGDLDSENAQEIVALMRRLNRDRGLTFLIVTHDIDVGRATDRIVRMVDGEVIAPERLETSDTSPPAPIDPESKAVP